MGTPEYRLQNKGRPWYSFLTIDIIVRVLARSIFHPAIVLISWLCIAAMHKHRTTVASYTLYYAAFLACVEVLLWFNHRITYGRPRKVNWEQEVVVITGGAKGLGRVIMEILVRRGVKVAVLDIKEPDEDANELTEGGGDLLWEVCDVADFQQIQNAAEKIQREFGPPTILINNAAKPIIGLPLLSTQTSASLLSPAQASQTLTINASSHFNTLAAFLPSMRSAPGGGTIVSISSILSHLSPAFLSDYAAAKSAVSALHHTLINEINTLPAHQGRESLKTLLVETGQIDTDLFSKITNLPWYANFFGPILEAKDVAREIINILDRGESGIIRMPFYAKCIPWYGVSPGSVQKLIRWFSGIDQAIGGHNPSSSKLQNGDLKSRS